MYKVVFLLFSVNLTSLAFKRVLNLSLNSRCLYLSLVNIPLTHTLSGRIGKVVGSHAAVARSIPLRCTDLYYARGAQGHCP